MRILVVSDTHGRHANLDKILETVGQIDMFVHLGDVENGEFYLDAVIECEKHIIGGNNDFFSDLPREEEFYIGKKKVFITHGHPYGVSAGTEELKRAGTSRGVDIVMFGHTHRPYLEIGEEITLLNPGSVSYPRQSGRKAGYMIITVEPDGELSYQQKFLN